MKNKVKKSLVIITALITAVVVFVVGTVIYKIEENKKDMEKVNVIIDTDVGSSFDDLFTLDLAARFHKENKINLLAVMLDRPDYSGLNGEGEFMKFLDAYMFGMGVGDIPLGKSTPFTSSEKVEVITPYWQLADGEFMKNTGRDLNGFLSAVSLYRKLLYEAKDNSVVICSLGFFNNIYALLKSEKNCNGDGIDMTGYELISKKVKELRIMAGSFDDSLKETGHGEYNVYGDILSAKYIFENFNAPVICTTWEVGLKLEYLASDVFEDCKKGGNGVIEATYKNWPTLPEGYINRLWDIMTLLPLVDENVAKLSSRGKVSVDEVTGVTTFTEGEGNVRYQLAEELSSEYVINKLRSIFKEGKNG